MFVFHISLFFFFSFQIQFSFNYLSLSLYIYIYIYIYICYFFISYSLSYPVDLGCRIRRLHLCKGVRIYPDKASYWSWEQPVKLQGEILVAEQSVTWQSKWEGNLQHYFGSY